MRRDSDPMRIGPFELRPLATDAADVANGDANDGGAAAKRGDEHGNNYLRKFIAFELLERFLQAMRSCSFRRRRFLKSND